MRVGCPLHRSGRHSYSAAKATTKTLSVVVVNEKRHTANWSAQKISSWPQGSPWWHGLHTVAQQLSKSRLITVPCTESPPIQTTTNNTHKYNQAANNLPYGSNSTKITANLLVTDSTNHCHHRYASMYFLHKLWKPKDNENITKTMKWIRSASFRVYQHLFRLTQAQLFPPSSVIANLEWAVSRRSCSLLVVVGWCHDVAPSTDDEHSSWWTERSSPAVNRETDPVTRVVHPSPACL